MIFFAIMTCLLSIMLSGCRTQTPPSKTDDPSATATQSATDAEHSAQLGSVTIEIVSPSSSSEESAAATATLSYENSFDVATGTTLEELMRKIESPQIVISGSGVTAFVQSIDGVATNATQGWTFTVDGEFATQGIGTTELTPEQTVRWRFTTMKEAMQQD